MLYLHKAIDSTSIYSGNDQINPDMTLMFSGTISYVLTSMLLWYVGADKCNAYLWMGYINALHIHEWVSSFSLSKYMNGLVKIVGAVHPYHFTCSVAAFAPVVHTYTLCKHVILKILDWNITVTTGNILLILPFLIIFKLILFAIQFAEICLCWEIRLKCMHVSHIHTDDAYFDNFNILNNNFRPILKF